MSNLKTLLPKMDKVLIPVEGSECSKKAIFFAGYLLAPLDKEVLEEIDLLHVISAGFLETTAPKIDFRVEFIKESSFFKRLREEYIQSKAQPLLDWAEQELKKRGITVPIKKIVLEGDPPKEIVDFSQKKGLHTVIMGRRGFSCLKERFVGSCSLAVCHRPGAHTTYVVGQKVNGTCPVERLLVPIDGSACSVAALREACGLLLAFKEKVKSLKLLLVIDVAYESDHLLERIEEAKNLLKQFKEKAVSFGVSESLIQEEWRIGRPANEIVSMAQEENIDVVIMGRRGLSGIKELIMGSVSNKVLHKAESFTLALVTA